MVKNCIENGCKVEPSFNFPNEKDRLYCGKHKLNRMVVGLQINKELLKYQKIKKRSGTFVWSV